MKARIRSAAIAFRGSETLVMMRRKQGDEYAVLVGGGVEHGEADQDAVMRELAEETGLSGVILADLGRPDERHHLFLVDAGTAEPVLGGGEARRANPWNRYRPAWVPVSELDSIKLRPDWAVDAVHAARRLHLKRRSIAATLLTLVLASGCGSAPPSASAPAAPSPALTDFTPGPPAPTASGTPTNTPLPTPPLTRQPGATIEHVPYAAVSASEVLDLHLPTTGGPWPVVVFVHGGSWMLGSQSMPDGTGYGALRQALLARGFAVASVQYRASTERRFPAQLVDVRTAIRFLRAHASVLGLDAARLAVIGDSAGGHLALLAALAPHDADLEGDGDPAASSGIRAAVSLYGVTDLVGFGADRAAASCPYGDEVGLAVNVLVGGDPGAAAHALAVRASPLTYAGASATPVLLLHGSRDCLVPPAQSQRFADARRSAGQPVQLRLLDAGHIDPAFYTPQALTEVTAFMAAALEGG